MFRPVARLTDSSGKTVAILCEQGPTAATLDVPAIPQSEFRGFLSRNMGNPLRSMRRKAGVSQKELASAMGISQPMVSKLERPGTFLSMAMATKASAGLKAILESRRRWKASPPQTFDDLLEVQAPLLELAARRKPRSPVERRLLQAVGDKVARREIENRTKPSGQRAMPPRRAR
jgi:transcriptional regulator with XRE-family HTH domain